MANSTYLQLVNKVIRQLNETELTSTTFSSARGVYGATKDAVQFAVNKINSVNTEWPFNYYEDQSQTLTIGENFYSFPSDIQSVDWQSFYIVGNTSQGVNTTPLKLIKKNDFHRYLKDNDFDNATDGLRPPMYVFPWGNRGFGVTPVPNLAYVVKYNYWKNPTQLSAHGDTTTIPSEWDHVIVLGAMWYSHLFKEDGEAVMMAKDAFDKALGDMRTVLINKPEDITDTRVNFGGHIGVITAIDHG